VAAELVIQAEAMTGVTTALSMPEWIIVLAVPSALVGFLGYRWIHRVMQATAVIVGVTLVVMLVQGLHHALPASETTLARPSAGLFAAALSLLVIDMLSFGPFTADYSRYLPAKTSARRLILANYTGNILATIASCAVGAYLAALLPKLTVIGAVGQISGKWALVIMAFSLLNANTFNAYTGSFQILSLGSMSGSLWRRVKAESVTVRVIPFLAVMAVGTVIACYGYQEFVNNLSNFLDDLLILLIPWSAVNLTDYFLVRHGDYDITSFFTPDGIYGRFAWRGLLAYVIGLVAELPFAAQPDYTGWLVKSLGGADISWLVGWIIAAGVYLVLTSRTPQAIRDRPTAVPLS
jgi:NCS1 family nucleobase:cation symporter-1